MRIPPPELAIERLRAFLDHGRFCAETLKIRSEDGTTVPLVLTPAQAKLAAAVEEAEIARRPVRIVALKARQVHMSVGACSVIWKRTAFLTGQQSLLIGNDHKTTKNLWNYCNQFTLSYSGEVNRLMVVRSKRPTDNSPGSIEFAKDSWINTATAGTTTSGRSFSLRHLLMSEHAFYRDAVTLSTGLLQSVPDDPDTTILIESTANGMGGPFYERCQAAMDPRQRGDWRFLFFGWWEFPAHTRPLEGDRRRFQDSLTKYEMHLVQTLRVSFEQLAWRRWAIVNKCEGSENRFRQEHPATPEEAFLMSGRPRFDQTVLSRMPIVREWLTGDLDKVRVGTSERVQFLPREDGRGSLHILRKPQPGEEYIIGADTAQGIDAGSESGKSDPDYSVGCVINQGTGEQVAVLRERLTPATFAGVLVDLARWYNDAFIVPESTGLGIATIEGILAVHYPLDRVYWRRRTPDDRRPQKLEDLGFQTSAVTKPQLISGLERALLEMSVIVRHPITLQELLIYSVDAQGRTNASTGGHDDCTIALALAIVGLSAAPLQRPPRPVGVADSAPVSYRKWQKNSS